MADEEPLRQVAQSHAPFSVWLGIVFLFALFGVIVLAIIGPSPRSNSYEQNRAKKRLDILNKLREEDAKALTTYSWIDKEKQMVRIPIQRAMELTVVQLAQMKPTAAGPIATPPAPPAPSVATSPGSPAASPGRSPAPPAAVTPKPKTVEGVESENRGQPAGATNPAPARPASQPGASATPAATPAPAGTPASGSAAGTPSPTPPGTPLPIRGKTPGQTP
jgi:hypothetical protein